VSGTNNSLKTNVTKSVPKNLHILRERPFDDDAAVTERARAARLARRTALVVIMRPPGVMLASTSKQLPSSESIKAHPVLVNDAMMPIFARWNTLKWLTARRGT
jgi:hypothetical protein